jgi:predicted  nucleic acid-binding Zn-ribbon protein
LTDYTEKAYQSNVKSVQSTLNGFAAMITPAEAAIAKTKELQLQLEKATGDERDRIAKNLQSLESETNAAVPTIENMTAALQSQIDHLQAYYDNLAKIKAGGFSADVLAMVSGGTAQDMDNAKALADAVDKYGADSEQVKKLNEQVAEVKAKTGELAATMTENTLAVDSNVTQMVDAYTKALEGLNQYDGAKASATQTVQGIVDGLGENASSVQEQVNGILAMLAELSNASYTVPGISFNQAVTGGVSTGAQQATEAETSFLEAMAANPVKVQTNVFLDGQQISQNTASHMADSVRAAERSVNNP